MRIYEGSPRQDFEEVLRSVGALLPQRGLREVLLAEAPDGFVVQGLVVTQAGAGGWSESVGAMSKETLTFLDDDTARVIGRWIDEQKPRDIFFFEQDGAFVLRLLMAGQVGMKHVLAEFTKDDIERMIEQGPAWRNRSAGPKAGAAPEAATQTT